MCSSKIAVSFLVGVLALGLGASGDDLTLVVNTDKEIYEFGEPIVLTVTVSNNSTHTYRLATTPFNRPATALLGTKPPPDEPVRALPEHFVGIKSPTGRPVHSEREYGRCVIARRPQTITLGPGNSHIVRYNLMEHYPERRSLAGPHNFDEPGTYELIARYYLDYAQYWPQFYEGIFVGPIQSEPVRFVVKPLAGPRVEELLEQLSSEDPASAAEAVALLRRGGAVRQIANPVAFLDEDQPVELRVQAAYAIYDAPDLNAWETYAEFLDDSHWMIRSMMAGALSRIGNKAAGHALYAATDPVRYPRSYWVAFEALIQIGDPRAREVAARLAESAESPALREMAAKFLRDGVLHDGTSVPTNHSESGQPLPDD